MVQNICQDVDSCTVLSKSKLCYSSDMRGYGGLHLPDNQTCLL